MSFNDQGEIIRPFNGTTDDNGSLPRYGSWSGEWGCLFITFIIALIIFMAYYTCGTPTENSTADSPVVSIAESHPFGYGYGKVSFCKSTSINSDVEISIDGTATGLLCRSSATMNVGCYDEGTISFILPVGDHSVYATDHLGRYSYFQLNVVDGECQVREIKFNPPASREINSSVAKLIDGDWYGMGYQTDSKDRWEVLFSFRKSTNEFRINYPSSGCIGIWNIEYLSRETISFKEHILFGKIKFVDLMEIDLKVINRREIQLNYYYPGGQSLIAKAILKKL